MSKKYQPYQQVINSNRYSFFLKINFLLLIYIVHISVFGQKEKIDPNGYNVFYGNDSSVVSEGYMKNGKPDGYWKNYYDTGIINIKNLVVDSFEGGKIKFYVSPESKDIFSTKNTILNITEADINTTIQQIRE